jgi:hypothetical protein
MTIRDRALKLIDSVMPYAKNFPVVYAQLESIRREVEGKTEFTQDDLDKLANLLVELCTNMGVTDTSFIGRQLKKKSFWLGLGSIGAGIALCVAGDFVNGGWAIFGGLSLIFVGDGIKKSEISSDQSSALTVASKK